MMKTAGIYFMAISILPKTLLLLADLVSANQNSTSDQSESSIYITAKIAQYLNGHEMTKLLTSDLPLYTNESFHMSHQNVIHTNMSHICRSFEMTKE